MTDKTIRSGTPLQPAAKTNPAPLDNTSDAVKKPAGRVRTEVPPPAPKTVKGQKHVAPAGRHSQQTHRRAQERAAAEGHATEQEQHAHDRNLVQTAITQRAQRQQQQRDLNARSATPKVKAQEAPQENTQE